MELSVHEAARLLAVSEETLHRWIPQRSLPAHRMGSLYRLNLVELQEWAAANCHRLALGAFQPDGTGRIVGPGLCEALEHGGIHGGIAGARKVEVLDAITRLPGIPPGVDHGMLSELLVAHETLAPTCIRPGIALPLPRCPVVLRISEPRVLLCFLAQPVDFGGPGLEPIHALFLLISPSVRTHLQLLAGLEYALYDSALGQLLCDVEHGPAILKRIRMLTAGEPQ